LATFDTLSKRTTGENRTSDPRVLSIGSLSRIIPASGRNGFVACTHQTVHRMHRCTPFSRKGEGARGRTQPAKRAGGVRRSRLAVFRRGWRSLALFRGLRGINKPLWPDAAHPARQAHTARVIGSRHPAQASPPDCKCLNASRGRNSRKSRPREILPFQSGNPSDNKLLYSRIAIGWAVHDDVRSKPTRGNSMKT